MRLVLRDGSAEDASACAAIWSCSVTDRDGGEPADLEEVRARLGTGAGSLRIAEHEGAPDRPLGFALALPAGDDVLLSHLAVVPEAHRQGIAARLLEDCAETARRSGAPALLLEVRLGNLAANALYHGAGFTAVRAPRPHPFGGQPLQLLRLDLR